MIDSDALDYEKGGGMITVVTQDDRTGRVLMVAHADRGAVEQTMATGLMHYRSRTRGPWLKGSTSGHVQRVVSLAVDCDRDVVLARVIPAGPACHTGAVSCFFDDGDDPLARLDALIEARLKTQGDARTGYTGRLLDDENLRLKKLGEEATELAVACARHDTKRAIEEAADLVYHLMVALRAAGGTWQDVREVLARRGQLRVSRAPTASIEIS